MRGKLFFVSPTGSGWEEGPYLRRHFLKLFRRKSGTVHLRPGAMPPEAVRRAVQQFGVGKVVEILRIGYDGTVDDIPIIVEIIDIGKEGFTGKVINVEREIIEGHSHKTLVYARRGGGVIEFRYDDGDIKEILESRDDEELAEARDVAALTEVLSALEVDDPVLVAYYDRKHRGTVNVEGRILSKEADGTTFTLRIEKINNIELEKKIEQRFNIERDLVIDISLV
ncbi:MAG: hypothetical protein D6681_02090 [Calditrichaeota bacterium]|nr:MAG: hypothetical protein D6681_02090 [Calditrichota bacterium]